MGKKAMQILSLKDEEFYEGCGIYFVELVTEPSPDMYINKLFS
jgi:hypothetical protein